MGRLSHVNKVDNNYWQNYSVRSRQIKQINEEYKMDLTKNGVLSVTTIFFRKFQFSLRTSYKELFILILFKSVGVLFECTFPCEYPQIKTSLILIRKTDKNSKRAGDTVFGAGCIQVSLALALFYIYLKWFVIKLL